MLISIIAAQPPDTFSIASTEDELALARVKTALASRDQPDHEVRFASSLGELCRHLEELQPKAGTHVQIIGHGSPGMLALGYFWTGDYYSKSDTFALDSDLSRHGVLDGLVAPGTKVSLIGCAVGEDRVGLAQCDGPTLIFDLARMWACQVSAPVGPVGPDDFDKATGEFLECCPKTDASRIVTASDRCVTKKSSPLTKHKSSMVVLPRIEKISRMQILGPQTTEQRLAQASRALMEMGPLMVHQIAYNPLLAMPEIVAELEDGTTATFLSNVSVIRVSRPDSANGHVYYAPVVAPDVQRVVRHAVRSAL